jgi:hypothetical protein
MDMNVRAFRTVQAALSEPVAPDKRKAAARKGGLLGGRSRANSLSAARRKEIAEQGSAARWKRRITK